LNESYLIWGIGLLAAALLLVMLEAFLPSAGMIGLLAAAVAIGGIVCLFKVSIVWGIIGIFVFIGVGGVGFIFALSIMPNTRFGRRLVHGDDPNALADESEDSAPPSEAGAEFEHLIGKEGVVVSDLRPVGAIKIGDDRHQAISEVSYIRTGTRVRVTSVDGTQIKVRPLR
jgi:membrane-bound serine protease (ClpP class)